MATATRATETAASDVEAFCDDPAAYFHQSYDEMELVPRQALARLQLAALQYRFGRLRDAIPMLKKLADGQDIQGLERIEDVIPLLFEHTMYKSYRVSLLENRKFGEINKWLSRLTAFDLTGIDVSACRSIDDWVEVMDRESPLTLLLSSGTTGTMSLIPVSKAEYDKFGRMLRVTCLQQFGKPKTFGPEDEIFCIYPNFRYGTSAHLRTNDLIVKYIAGDEAHLFTAYPGKMSADVLFLAA